MNDMVFDKDAFMSLVMDDPLVRDTWHRKYRHVLPDGTSTENTVADTRTRVVNGVYTKDPDVSAKARAVKAVQMGLLVPAGRINAGSGLPHNVTLINCFVNETVQDSMPGIQRVIMRTALTLQGTGGLGTDWSTVRPDGAIVVRGNSEACGVIPFMDQQDATCKTIAVNDRRGALMSTLRDDHPDLWNERQFETTVTHTGDTVLKYPSFISAKRQKNRLTQCNMSILVSNAFLAAIDADADWDLGFHVPRRNGNHVAVYDKPFPYDMYDDDNEIVDDPVMDRRTSHAGLKIAKGTMLPWYVYTRVKARRIWDDIMRSTYVYAEPGVIFIDRINERNSLWYCEDIRCTNPCGEKPLPPHGICDLSSVNAAFMVHEPFTKHAEFNFDAWLDTIEIGVRFLDNVLDVSKYPLQVQRDEAMAKRRIGLGPTGWGDAMIQLGIVYGSKESVDFTRKAARMLRDHSYLSSAFLAKERGPFPLFDKDKFLSGYNARLLPEFVREAIAEYGIRNGELNDIAPNGTNALYNGNISPGHEPVYSFQKSKRKVRQRDNSFKEYESMDYALRLFEHIHGPVSGDQKLPPAFVGALDISVDAHLVVHAAWHEFIDASVSKTVNVPESMPFDDFKEVYRQAYDLGCKGCTTYRPDPTSGRGSVLSVETKETPTEAPIIDVVESSGPVPRPEVLDGRTYKLTWPITGKNWYVTITSEGSTPKEMFVTSADPAAQEWITALCRTTTAIMRRGGDLRFLVEQLGEVCSATGGAFIAAQHAFRPSVVAAIAGIMEVEFRRLGLYGVASASTPMRPLTRATFAKKELLARTLAEKAEGIDAALLSSAVDCPQCTMRTLIRESGCKRCLSCGYNSCS
jgi:ribonucleoside-diphosphate reductase alpha chain